MKKYLPSAAILVLFETVAVVLWLTKDNLFYLLNFSYIGICLAAGLTLFTAGKRYARHVVQLAVGFYMLVYLMVTKYRKVDVSAEIVRDHKNRNRLSTITNYIKDNYQKDLSLEGLAQIFGYSPTYLSRMFRKYAEINYKEYIQGIRLEYAYRELISSDTMVEEIAEHSGFADGRAFAKAFRKKYGVRPSDFRKMRKQESEDEKL